jgi:hypothetical protein
MQIIQHRVNSIADLEKTPVQFGVELDIRDKYDSLVIQHDPFTEGADWNAYLNKYHHGLLIANIKTEGIEQRIISDLKQIKLDNYFLLDVSFPFLVKLCNQGIRKMAVRFSEYEPVELALSFAGKLDWVWVDCFTHLPLDAGNYEKLKKHFQICVVSPELQGHGPEAIRSYRTQLADFEIAAVCTKYPELWLS